MCTPILLCPRQLILKEKGTTDPSSFGLHCDSPESVTTFSLGLCVGSERVPSELSTLTTFEVADAIMSLSAVMLFVLVEISTSAGGYAVSFLTKAGYFKPQVCQQPAPEDSQRDQQPVLVPWLTDNLEMFSLKTVINKSA